MPILYPEEKWKIFRQQDFSGCENKLYVPELVAPNQVLSALNLVKTPEGLLQTRLGKTRLNTTSLGTGGIISIHRYAKENGNKYLVVQHGSSLYAVSWDGSATISSFGTAVKTGLDAAKLRSVTWKDKLILTNGVDNIFTYDGTSCVDLAGTPPKSKIIKVYASRAWLIDVANPNYLRFSDLEDPGVWNAANLIKIKDGDGDNITTISPQPEGLLVFKTNNTWALYGADKNTIRVTTSPIFPSIGCLSPDGVIDEGVVIGPENIYGFDLGNIKAIGDTHKPLIHAMTLTQKQNAIVVAVARDNRALVMLTDASVLNLEALLGGITSWSGLNVGCFAVCSAKDDDGSLLVGDKTNGIVYKLNNTVKDVDTDIISELETAENDMGTPVEKVFRAFHFRTEMDIAGSIHVKYQVDSQRASGSTDLSITYTDILTWGSSNWDESKWGGYTKFDSVYWLHGVRGNRISCGIRATERIKFLGYWLKYREVRTR